MNLEDLKVSGLIAISIMGPFVALEAIRILLGS